MHFFVIEFLKSFVRFARRQNTLTFSVRILTNLKLILFHFFFGSTHGLTIRVCSFAVLPLTYLLIHPSCATNLIVPGQKWKWIFVFCCDHFWWDRGIIIFGWAKKQHAQRGTNNPSDSSSDLPVWLSCSFCKEPWSFLSPRCFLCCRPIVFTPLLLLIGRAAL